MDDDQRDQRDQRDEDIVSARIAGTSLRALAKQYGCTSREVEEAIDRRLSYELDNRQRLRLVKLSVERILSLMQPFYDKAIREKCCASGTLVCKLEERLSLLLGTDAPTTQRVDIYQVEQQQKPSRYERIHDAIMRVANSAPPAQRAVIRLMDEYGPDEVLRRLEAAGIVGKAKVITTTAQPALALLGCPAQLSSWHAAAAWPLAARAQQRERVRCIGVFMAHVIGRFLKFRQPGGVPFAIDCPRSSIASWRPNLSRRGAML